MQAEPRPKKLLDQVWDAVRLKHYSYRTEQTYMQWIRRFILFHHRRHHPQEMGVPEIEAFLTNLAVQERVAASINSLYPKSGIRYPTLLISTRFDVKITMIQPMY